VRGVTLQTDSEGCRWSLSQWRRVSAYHGA